MRVGVDYTRSHDIIGQYMTHKELQPSLASHVWDQYQHAREQDLERAYTTSVRPLLAELVLGLHEREGLLSLFSYWKDLKKTEYGSITLQAELSEYLKSRAGDEIVPFIEEMMLMQHLLIHVYEVPVSDVSTLSQENIEKWRSNITEHHATPEVASQTLEKEEAFLAAYRTQYADFASLHFKQLLTASAGSSTPGSTRRRIFNAVLYALYDFDPQIRDSWQVVEKSGGELGLLSQAYRAVVEEKTLQDTLKIESQRKAQKVTVLPPYLFLVRELYAEAARATT